MNPEMDVPIGPLAVLTVIVIVASVLFLWWDGNRRR